jgi:phosphoribosylanthranilate isomerase
MVAASVWAATLGVVNPRTRIKICGVCRAEDATLAARAGADAIGLLFHPASPRNIAIDRAREILGVLPPFVTPVGLFVGAAVETVRETARQLGLRHVQLHGDETPEQVKGLSPLIVVKAIRVERDRFAGLLEVWRAAVRSLNITNLAGFVLETAGTDRPGGTGIANDWEAVQEAQRAGAFNGLPAIIAAGGLTPESVGAVVRAIRPYAVDVSSGVEASKGYKSDEKVRAFIKAVRDADA